MTAHEADFLVFRTPEAPIRARDLQLFTRAIDDLSDTTSAIETTYENKDAAVTISSGTTGHCSNCEVNDDITTIRYNPPYRNEVVEHLCSRCYNQFAQAAFDQYNRDDALLAVTPAVEYRAVLLDMLIHPIRKQHTPMLERKLMLAANGDYDIGGGYNPNGEPVQITTTGATKRCEHCGTEEAETMVRFHYADPDQSGLITTFYCPDCSATLQHTVASYVAANADDLLADSL